MASLAVPALPPQRGNCSPELCLLTPVARTGPSGRKSSWMDKQAARIVWAVSGAPLEVEFAILVRHLWMLPCWLPSGALRVGPIGPRACGEGKGSEFN